jgi:hypothetical protein
MLINTGNISSIIQHQSLNQSTTTTTVSTLTPETNPNMPGFNSFLLGNGPFTSFRPDTPPQPDSDSEPEAVRKVLRRKQRRQAAQVTTLYGTTMSRKDVEATRTALEHLQHDVSTQMERFHDASISDPKARPLILRVFVETNNAILRYGAAILRRFEVKTGPIEDFQAGLGDLGRVSGIRLNGDAPLDVDGVLEIVGMYRAGIVKPLGDMVKGFGKALASEKGWRPKE